MIVSRTAAAPFVVATLLSAAFVSACSENRVDGPPDRATDDAQEAFLWLEDVQG